MGEAVDLLVVIAAGADASGLAAALPKLREALAREGIRHEISVVDGGSGALAAALVQAQDRHVLTLDPHAAASPQIVLDLWRERDSAEIVIGACAGGGVLGRALDRFLARWLGLPVRSVSSGLRLYDGRVLRGGFATRGLALQSEILVRACAEGWRVREVGLGSVAVNGRTPGALSSAAVHLQPFARLWRLRNSILSADYDDRAYDSAIFLQRFWQRLRLRHVIALVGDRAPALDVGCGSSRILSALPAGSVGVDILLRKLRYSRRFGRRLVQASGLRLPFRDGLFPCVVCSQVIEHVPRDSPLLDELDRVLAPGGRLVLGTPDYGSWRWPAIEAVYERVAPDAYAQEHVSPYRRRDLVRLVESRGLVLEDERSILGAELILAFKKPMPASQR